MIKSKTLASLLYEITKDGDDINKSLDLFIKFLIKNNLENQLPNIYYHLEYLIKKDQDFNKPKLKSSHNLSKKTQDFLIKKFSADTTEPLEFSLKEDLIGGFTLEHRGVMYDGSLIGQLKLLKQKLLTN